MTTNEVIFSNLVAARDGTTSASGAEAALR